MHVRIAVIGAGIGLALAMVPLAANADFGIPCGKAGGCVDPPTSGGWDPQWALEPQQLFFAYLGNAQQAMRDGNWDAAEGWARRALEEQPGNAEAQAILSQLAYARKRRAALAANESGLQLFAQGDYESAMRMFSEALAQDPRDMIIQKNLDNAKARVQVAGMRSAAEAMVTTARLNAQAAAAEAQRLADGKARASLENLADKLAGLAWAKCVGLACQQAAAGAAIGGDAKTTGTDEGASDTARFPFDDRGGSIVVIPPSASAPVTLPTRPLTGEGAAMRDRIAALHDEDTKLATQIKIETDGMKRAGLIQRQAFVRSQKRVEEIKLATFVARYAPDTKASADGKGASK